MWITTNHSRGKLQFGWFNHLEKGYWYKPTISIRGKTIYIYNITTNRILPTIVGIFEGYGNNMKPTVYDLGCVVQSENEVKLSMIPIDTNILLSVSENKVQLRVQQVWTVDTYGYLKMVQNAELCFDLDVQKQATPCTPRTLPQAMRGEGKAHMPKKKNNWHWASASRPNVCPKHKGIATMQKLCALDLPQKNST